MSGLRRTIRRATRFRPPADSTPERVTFERVLHDVHFHGTAVFKLTREQAILLYPEPAATARRRRPRR
jgi:hypothetical protein